MSPTPMPAPPAPTSSAPAPGHPTTASATPPKTLTPTQLHALFEILTHHEIYREAESCKLPGYLSQYGYPFTLDGAAAEGEQAGFAQPSAAPMLAALLRSFVLTHPLLRDLPLSVWNVQLQGILTRLAQAELSESYDKGVLGMRKTMATVMSVGHGYINRAMLGGLAKGEKRDLKGHYDKSKAHDLERAWEHVLHELTYGSLMDELFACAAQEGGIESHSEAVRVAVDYIIIHLATLLHRLLVLSPQGPFLLKLVENIHELMPYTMIRQTLRIGNAATMLNGMSRLFLAKMSVGALTNWVGITTKAKDGMNLMQRILSLVLSWDSAEFGKFADGIETAEDGPSREHLDALRQFITKPREVHEEARQASMDTQTSMVATIFRRHHASLLASLSPSQHAQCLDYLSALLSMRDRDEIVKVLCRSDPDLLTQMVREVVTSSEAKIRMLHDGVDLREHITSMETFLRDLIKTSKPSKPTKPTRPTNVSSEPPDAGRRWDRDREAPSIEDYVDLLRRNRHLLYNFLRQAASKCPDLERMFRSWANDSMQHFRQSRPRPRERDGDGDGDGDGHTQAAAPMFSAAGAASDDLQALFAALATEEREAVVAAIDGHATYLASLKSISSSRMQDVLDTLSGGSGPGSGPGSGRCGRRGRGSISGPGVYLWRWRDLLDETPITPELPAGPLRRGKHVKERIAKAKAKVGGAARQGSADTAALLVVGKDEEHLPSPPRVDVVTSALNAAFRERVLGGRRDGM